MRKFSSGIVLIFLIVLSLVFSVNSNAVGATNYVTGIMIVSPVGNSLDQASDIVTPSSDHKANIGVAVTFNIPQGLELMDFGFTTYYNGVPYANYPVENPIGDTQVKSGSFTRKYLLEFDHLSFDNYPAQLVFKGYYDLMDGPNIPGATVYGTYYANNISVTINSPPSESSPSASLEDLRIQVSTDKKVYESGERVVVSGAIQKLNSQGQYVSYEGSLPFQLAFSFPGARGTSIVLPKDGKMRTLSDGTFKIVPFAPYSLGTYTVTMILSASDYPTYLTTDLKGNTTFTAVAPRQADQSQIDELLLLYYSEIPSNAIAVDEQLRLWGQSDVQFALALQHPETRGYYNNQFFHQNGFHCQGYTVKVIEFLNGLRFNQTEKYRQLFRGLDYSPIMRGARGLTAGSGEHHAVVVYKYGTDWKTGDVFDPWLTQIPSVFNVTEFEGGFAGTARFDPDWVYGGIDVNGEAEILNEPSFPIQPAPVYWNFDWALAPVRYPDSNAWLLHRGYGWTIGTGSPVALDISNANGQRIYMQTDGEMIAQIEGSEVSINRESSTDMQWYVWLPDGEYQIKIIGLASGTAHIFTSQEDGVIQYYNTTTTLGQIDTLKINTANPGEPLIMQSGEPVFPQVFHVTASVDSSTPTSTVTTSSIVTGTEDSTDTVFTILGLAVVALVIIGVTVLLRRRTRTSGLPPPPPPLP